MKAPPAGSNLTQRDHIYTNQIVTLADLQDLKLELLEEIRKLLREQQGQPGKKWLKTSEVRKLLDASPGTLQRLRNDGTLPHKKIGGIVYYDYEQISKMLAPDQFSQHKSYKK
ncbi:DNA-binding protein [Chitinophaga caeni]|uniref:DNA-binding protein n=1 Tax=Chitinophaga caeni TaxID=2029983 RepID=A0A291QYH2_9BACT|nr:helix-turn-helix domain-containing protein [Chitinophaga caeni]ATL48990.1 DNA-binding protein [Chitinophaga caeni]